MWRSQWLPEIDLKAEAGHLPLDSRPADGSSSISGQIVAKMELFSGFATVAEKRASTKRILKNEAQLKAAILKAVTDMETAYREIFTIQKRVDLGLKNKERAKQYYLLVMKEYGRGVKNSSDVNSASRIFSEAELRERRFALQFLNQRIDLERALGGPVKVEILDPNSKH